MGLVDRAKNMIVSPKSEWPVVATEEPDTGAIITGHVLPLALIAAIASFIGYAFVGVTMPFVGTVKGISYGIGNAINVLVGAILTVLIGAAVINALAPTFNSEKNYGRAVQLVAYSYTVVWVAGVLNVFPVLGLVGIIASLYALYVMYLGFPYIMKTPQEKVVVYEVVAIVVMIVVYIVIGLILAPILALVGFGLTPTA